MMSAAKITLALLIAQTFCLFFPQTIFCQTETLDIVQYTPPKGWAKKIRRPRCRFLDQISRCGN